MHCLKYSLKLQDLNNHNFYLKNCRHKYEILPPLFPIIRTRACPTMIRSMHYYKQRRSWVITLWVGHTLLGSAANPQEPLTSELFSYIQLIVDYNFVHVSMYKIKICILLICSFFYLQKTIQTCFYVHICKKKICYTYHSFK